MRPKSDQEKINRRGCTAFAVLILLIVLVLVAVSVGWFGQTDRKIPGIPAIGGNVVNLLWRK